MIEDSGPDCVMEEGGSHSAHRFLQQWPTAPSCRCLISPQRLSSFPGAGSQPGSEWSVRGQDVAGVGGVWNKVQGLSWHLVGHAACLDTQVSLSLPSGSLSDPCLVAVSSDALLFSWSVFSPREVVRPLSS